MPRVRHLNPMLIRPALAATLLTPALLAPHAGAQEGVFITATSSASPGGLGDAQITRTSSQRYADLLALDDEQRDVLDLLFEGYSTSYQDARATMTREMEKVQAEFQDTQDFTLFRDRMPKIMGAFRDRASSLESSFFSDLDAILRDDQRERMVRVERMRRRETSMDFSVSGASVDLLDLVRDLEVSPDPALLSTLDEYELTVDRLLQEAQRDESPFSEGAQRIDPEQLREYLKVQRERALRMREINRRHARLIEGSLSEDQRARFADALRERSFPQVYRAPHARRLLDAAAEFADLSPEQRERLTQVRESYLRDLDKANARWAAEIEKADENAETGVFAAGPGNRTVFSMRQGEGDTPADQARKARRELDEQAEQKLREILSEDQIARLPERTRDEGDTVRFGGAQTIRIGGGT